MNDTLKKILTVLGVIFLAVIAIKLVTAIIGMSIAIVSLLIPVAIFVLVLWGIITLIKKLI